MMKNVMNEKQHIPDGYKLSSLGNEMNDKWSMI